MTDQSAPTIFISWSGEAARQAGLVIRDWLNEIYQRVDVFYSPESIEKGLRGYVEIQDAINRAVAAIVVVTPESVSAPWVNFEAGALSMQSVEGGGTRKVIPFLVGLDSPADVTGPLTQFQMTTRRKDDVVRMVASLNKVMGIDESKAEGMVDAQWNQLDAGLEAVDMSETPVADLRTDRQILEEVLELVRGNSAKATTTASAVIERFQPFEHTLSPREAAKIIERQPAVTEVRLFDADPSRPDIHVRLVDGYTDDDVKDVYEYWRRVDGALTPPVILNVNPHLDGLD